MTTKSRCSIAAHTKEGGLIAALSGAQLAAYEARCAVYAAKCEAAGKAQSPKNAAICAGIAAEVVARAACVQHIGNALHLFAALMHYCRSCGYDVPPVIGTPPSAETLETCEALRAAIRAHERQPDDGTLLTRDEAQRGIDAALRKLNAPREETRPDWRV